MLADIRGDKTLQRVLGLLTGILFGFLLQRSGVTHYDVILGQLLLVDFTVLKVMLSAVVTGMVGVYLMRDLGWVRLHPKPGSLGTTLIGGLLFGVGFAILGYCPGTLSGAIGQGSLDALVGGAIGMVMGAWLFAVAYPKLQRPILDRGTFGSVTLPDVLKVNAWLVVIPAVLVMVLALVGLEASGL
jgi:hypothetical protein